MAINFARYTQKLFGGTALSEEIGNFGSLANGAAAYPTVEVDGTLSLTDIQSLPPFTGGWFDAVLGLNYPAIEDMNALFYAIFYQLCCILQKGITQYDSGTTYFVGSQVNVSGVNYVCINDNSGAGIIAESPTNATYWAPPGGNAVAPTGSYAVLPTDDMILVASNTLHGAGFTITLPSCSAVPVGKTYWIKNAIASTSYQNLVAASGSDEIDGSSGYDIPATSSAYVIVKNFSNATNGIWWIVGSGT